MRPVLFIVCFSVGLGLMILSGHLPKSASAGGASAALPAVSDDDKTGHPRPYRPVDEGERAHRLSGVTEQRDTPAVADPWPREEPAEAEDVPPSPTIVDSDEDSDEVAEAAEREPAVAVVDESADEEQLPPEPHADAGPDQIVWIGWDELSLDGRGSSGAELSYQWSQTVGPVVLQVTRPRAAQTVAQGFPVGEEMDWSPTLYEFELAVTDRHDRQHVDTVQYVVLAAPELEVTPRADRRFLLRDGYYLAHFEAWKTNTETDETTFQITSPTVLTFTQVTGGAFELSSEQNGRRYTYSIMLFRPPDEGSSWLELLVDTEEKVPGIVQLGVSWDGRYARRDRKPANKETVQ